jgi:uncharacterized membrane protein YqhA
MQHLEGSGMPVLFIGRTVLKGQKFNLILSLFLFICYSVFEHPLCHVSLCIVLLPDDTMSSRVLSNIDEVCICSLFLFVIFLLHDIFVSNARLFGVSFQIPPRQPQGPVFTNNLSIYTSNTLATH